MIWEANAEQKQEPDIPPLLGLDTPEVPQLNASLVPQHVDEDEAAWIAEEVEVAEEEVYPPVSDAIKTCFNQLWEQGIRGPENIKIKETYGSIYRPSNVETLIKTQVNDEVMDNLLCSIQRRDSLPKALQNGVIKSDACLTPTLK